MDIGLWISLCSPVVMVSNRPQTASGKPIFGKPDFLTVGLVLTRLHRRSSDYL